MFTKPYKKINYKTLRKLVNFANKQDYSKNRVVCVQGKQYYLSHSSEDCVNGKVSIYFYILNTNRVVRVSDHWNGLTTMTEDKGYVTKFRYHNEKKTFHGYYYEDKNNEKH